MLHKLSARSATSFQNPSSNPRSSLHIARPGARAQVSSPSGLRLIIARRCSAFCAEAAVLVLVFGLLDYFMSRGHIEPLWAVGALVVSLGLLAASIVTEHSAGRWLGAHP